jgi:hypothetical protein
MTPYGSGQCFVVDVTNFAAELNGPRSVRSFVDTWVGPGSPSGDGWQVTASFVFHPPQPGSEGAEQRVEVIPLWNPQAEEQVVDVGNPGQPLTELLPAVQVTIPENATRVELRQLITGHGQGNQGNCAEFCRLRYVTKVGTDSVALEPWRGDCAQNPLSTQAGNWSVNRAGWCPGAPVEAVVTDITAVATPGETHTFEYDVLSNTGTSYENSCRPDAGDAGNLCQGCAFDAEAGNCDYDDGLHTPPHVRFSAQLLVHRFH